MFSESAESLWGSSSAGTPRQSPLAVGDNDSTSSRSMSSMSSGRKRKRKRPLAGLPHSSGVSFIDSILAATGGLISSEGNGNRRSSITTSRSTAHSAIEIFGETATGKTQILLTLAVEHLLENHFMGEGGESVVYYYDLDCNFDSEVLFSIIRAKLSEECDGFVGQEQLDEKILAEVANKMIIVRAGSMQELVASWDLLRQKLKKKMSPPSALILIDSLTSFEFTNHYLDNLKNRIEKNPSKNQSSSLSGSNDAYIKLKEILSISTNGSIRIFATRLKGKMPLGENSVWKDKIKPVKIEVKRAEGEEEGNFIASKFPANGRAYPFKVVEGRGVISEEGKKEADDDRGISGNSAANSNSTDQRSVAV